MKRLLLAAVLLTACGSEERSAPTGLPSSSGAVRVLVVTATAGFRRALSAPGLSQHDVVMFALTSGESPLTDSQKSALVEFVSCGRGFVDVLLRLDASSVGTTGDYPLAWAHSFGSGRAYYNALGHFAETWTDTRFQRQLIGAIRWVAGRV